ncbi:hypothetical protein D3C75_1038100 [compost metagenome]
MLAQRVQHTASGLALLGRPFRQLVERHRRSRLLLSRQHGRPLAGRVKGRSTRGGYIRKVAAEIRLSAAPEQQLFRLAQRQRLQLAEGRAAVAHQPGHLGDSGLLRQEAGGPLAQRFGSEAKQCLPLAQTPAAAPVQLCRKVMKSMEQHR